MQNVQIAPPGTFDFWSRCVRAVWPMSNRTRGARARVRHCAGISELPTEGTLPTQVYDKSQTIAGRAQVVFTTCFARERSKEHMAKEKRQPTEVQRSQRANETIVKRKQRLARDIRKVDSFFYDRGPSVGTRFVLI